MKSNLKLIILDNFKNVGEKVDKELQRLMKEKESYAVRTSNSRFSNGEGKVKLEETVRHQDLYILCDVGNYSMSYTMHGNTHYMSPDEHFQDVKRVISATSGRSENITLIMPLLYQSRQHKRKGRESLDCAMAIQELQALGVKTIITFDVHDPNIQNATPCLSFENFYPTHTILETFIEKENLDFSNVLVISPDTGAMDRAIFYANMLNADVGMFYKRRDLTKVVDGKNPVVQHEYMGKDVKDKNIIVVDDMIASGSSMIEVASELKKRGANKIYLISTFALFTEGIELFQDAYEKKLFDKLYSTNLSYVREDVRNASWYHEVDCSSFIAKVIDTLHKGESIEPLQNGKKEMLRKINKKVNK